VLWLPVQFVIRQTQDSALGVPLTLLGMKATILTGIIGHNSQTRAASKAQTLLEMIRLYPSYDAGFVHV